MWLTIIKGLHVPGQTQNVTRGDLIGLKLNGHLGRVISFGPVAC